MRAEYRPSVKKTSSAVPMTPICLNSSPEETVPVSISIKRNSLLKLRWFSSVDELPGGLFDGCFRAPIEGSWWYSALERSQLKDQFQFEYLVVYADNIPVAVAPTFRMKVPMELVAPEFLCKILKVAARVLPDAEFQKTLFVGSVCSDEGTVGTVAGVTVRQVIPIISREVEKRGRQLRMQVIAWKDFIDADKEALDEHLLAQGFFKMPSYPGAVVSLPAGGFDDYLRSLTRSKRYKLRHKLKLSKELGQLNVSVIQRPDQKTLEEIFGLFLQTFEKGKTKFERLTPEFFRVIAEFDKAYFVILRQPDSGRMVAFMLCFALGERVINKFIGLDYSYAGNWFLYFRLWEAAVSWVMSIGCRELQSGQTGYAAKFDIGHELVPLTNYCKNLNPIINKIYSVLSKSVDLTSLDSDLSAHVKAHSKLKCETK